MRKRICVNWLGNAYHSSNCYQYMSLEAYDKEGGRGREVVLVCVCLCVCASVCVLCLCVCVLVCVLVCMCCWSSTCR